MSLNALPETLGRLRVLSQLGQGGMGSVYLAEDTVLKRRVAVKVPLLDRQTDPEVLARFLREAQAAAAIHHPNVCPVLDAGEQGDGYYLVMPYLEGAPLGELVGPERPWDPGQALDLVIKMAGGVQAIHDAGLIHRDLKPGNVLLTAEGEPIILDLGLVRPVAREDGEPLTRVGQMLGTPAYMPPEQLAGEGDLLGPPADVYALGVILYELLTGELPFQGPPAVLYAQILQATPRPPSSLRPWLGGWADRACRKAMAKEPRRRYGSAAALAEALGKYRRALGEQDARPPDHTERVTNPPPLPPQQPPSPEVTSPWQDLIDPTEGVVSERLKPRRSGTRRARPTRLPVWVAGLVGGLVLLVLLSLLGWLIASIAGAYSTPTTPPAGPVAGPDPAPEPPADPGPREEVPNQPPPGPAGNPAQPNPKPGPVKGKGFTNSIGMKFVPVPAGKFLMGSPKGEAGRQNDETQHEVEITKPYYMGAFEVTQEQYAKVMVGWNPGSYSTTGSKKDEVRGLDTRNFPVEAVTWESAQTFCETLSKREEEKAAGRAYRLPTEAEWEYACRAGTSTPFHFGDTITSHQANFNGTGMGGPYLQRPTPVGHYKRPNALGLHDMHGNVWEWCQDWYSKDYYTNSSLKDPKGPEQGTTPVFRGGSWYGLSQYCRAASRRGSLGVNNGSGDIGFRVVCVLVRGGGAFGFTGPAPKRPPPVPETKRVVLVELFADHWAPSVASQLAFDDLGGMYNPAAVVLLQYRPVVYDPLTNSASKARWEYHRKRKGEAIVGTPAAMFNGKALDSGGGPKTRAEKKSGDYREVLGTLHKEPARAQVRLQAVRDGDAIAITAEVSDLQEVGDDVRLRLVLAEKAVAFPAANGIASHAHLVRAFPGGADGLPLKEKQVKHSVRIGLVEVRREWMDFQRYRPKGVPDPGKIPQIASEGLEVVAFVQNDKTGEILQAARADVPETD